MKLPVRRVRLTAVALVITAVVSAAALAIGSIAQPAQAAAGTIEVWWPTEGVTVSGTQPFKALLTGTDLGQYRMYWQVDGRTRMEMANSYEDHPHKESLVDLSSWSGEGSYEVRFVATTNKGKKLAQRVVTINVAAGGGSSTTTTTVPATTSTTDPQKSGLSGATLYVDPLSPARAAADALRASRPYEASLLDKIAAQPTARWFGDWSGDIFTAVDRDTDTITAAGAVPVYVAYNIPVRDCSGYSAGGARSADEYRAWIRSFAEGVGDRPAAVIVEPDALALLDCLSGGLRSERLGLLSDAVEALSAAGSSWVYLDAGHARWHSAEETARRLEAAGISQARGFSLNVSNFVETLETVAYGQKVSELLGGKPFLVDTSRNGLGPSENQEWCNPPGRALGPEPIVAPGEARVDAYLWVKPPGESDGTCNGGPVAGQFWIDYALGLAERAEPGLRWATRLN